MSVRVWRTKFGELNIDHLTDLDRKTIFIIIAMLWSISLHFQKWPRQSKYEIIIFDIINAHQSCAINHFFLTPFIHSHSQGNDVRWSRDSIAFDQNTCSDVVFIWRFLMFFVNCLRVQNQSVSIFVNATFLHIFNIFVSSFTFKQSLT